MKLTAIQFAWIYLVKNGYAGVKQGYYGGWETYDDDSWSRGKWVDYKKLDELKLHAWQEILDFGVDWVATKAPRSDLVSTFEGTLADPSNKETLVGTLVLKNGCKQHWVADALEVTNVFEMMANAHNAVDDFKEYFGDKS